MTPPRERSGLLRVAIALAAIVGMMALLGWFMGWEKDASLLKPVPIDVESET